jgi:hypothetical protein
MESRDEQVAILEVLYQQSGNVTYAWEAITEFEPNEALPAWVRAYLAEAAVAAAGMVHDRDTSPERAVERLPGALRFVKPGRNGNAFGARRQAESDAELAWRYERAKAAWRTKCLGNTNELKSAIADVLKPKDPAYAGDVADISFVERRITRGRKILKAQETAKKKG